jgi:hypothetical protein
MGPGEEKVYPAADCGAPCGVANADCERCGVFGICYGVVAGAAGRPEHDQLAHG